MKNVWCPISVIFGTLMLYMSSTLLRMARDQQAKLQISFDDLEGKMTEKADNISNQMAELEEKIADLREEDEEEIEKRDYEKQLRENGITAQDISVGRLKIMEHELSKVGFNTEQIELIGLMMLGMPYEMIAKKMHLALPTVKYKMKNIFRTVDCKNQREFKIALQHTMDRSNIYWKTKAELGDSNK